MRTLKKWIREDKDMCREMCSLEIISKAHKYLSEGTERCSKEEEEGRGGWMEMNGTNRKMTLEQKTALMGLIREVVSEGGEIGEMEEVMRGIEGVIREGRERGDSEGMLAEEEGERLLWVIEKKSRGRDMKSFREIEREKEEERKKREAEMKKREEAERREEEEKKKREEAERKKEELEREKGEEKKKREEAERREEEEKKKREEVEEKLAELEKLLHPPAIDTLTSLSTTLTNSSVITLRGNTIIHTGPYGWESCTFNDELKNV